eukprot:4826059-Pleurochrysis_carterae.AAC.7
MAYELDDSDLVYCAALLRRSFHSSAPLTAAPKSEGASGRGADVIMTTSWLIRARYRTCGPLNRDLYLLAKKTNYRAWFCFLSRDALMGAALYAEARQTLQCAYS